MLEMQRASFKKTPMVSEKKGLMAWGGGLRSGLSVLGCLGLLWIGLICAEGTAYSAQNYRWYTVQPGDSCWSIAQMLFGRGSAYSIIHQYNDLGPMPHILKPGQRLKIPLSAPQPDAELEKKRREVKTKPPSALDWYDAREGMALWRLYKVSTGKRSLAVVRFERRARIRMREQALLVIHGRSERTRQKKSGKIVIQEGTVRAGLDSLDDAPIPIETPSAEVALKASAAQVGVDAQKTSMVSVFRGNAKVSAQGKSVQVPDDFGTYVKKGRPPAPPRRLPRAPRWSQGVHEAFVPMTPTQGQEMLELRWHGNTGDTRYRIEAAVDPRFRDVYWDDLVASAPAPTDSSSASVPSSPPPSSPSAPSLQRYGLPIRKAGDYYVRLSALDKDGLESRPSKTLHIHAETLQMSRQLARQSGGDRWVGVGLLQITPPKKAVDIALVEGDVSAIRSDALMFRSFQESVRLQKPGHYTLFFRRGPKGSVLTAFRIQLLQVKATLSLEQKEIGVQGQSVKAVLQLVDEKGFPVLLPGLRLDILPEGEGAAFRCVGRGQCEAMISAPKVYKHKALYIRASWAAGDLALAMISVKKPPEAALRRAPPPVEPSTEPSFRWPEQVLLRASPSHDKTVPSRVRVWEWAETPLVLEFARSFPGLPARGAKPMTWAGVRAFFGDYTPPNDAYNGPWVAAQGTIQKPVVSRFSIAGELALWHERMSLELDIPLLNVILTQPEGYPDNISYGKIGDIRIGIKGLLYERKDLMVGAGLRVILPTGGYRFPPRDAQGAVLPTFRSLERYTPGKSKANNALSTFFDPALLLEWRPLSWLMVHTNLAFVLDTDFGANTGFFFTGNAGLHLRWRFLSFVTEIHLVAPSVDGALPVTFGASAGVRAYLGQVRISLTGGGMIPQHAGLPGDFHVGIAVDLAFPSLR